MSEIRFTSEHTYEFGDDIITFPAIVDGRTVACSITLEELVHLSGFRSSTETFEEDFLQLRPGIEEHAKKKLLSCS